MLSKETQVVHDSHCRDGLCSHEEGGIGVYKKPQNRTNNNKKNRKTEINFDQNRNQRRRHVVEIVEAHIFRREFGKTPNRIE